MSEKLWYPEFGLRRNPFIYADKRKEIDLRENYEPVETEATRLVQDMVNFGGQVIIHGPKGCGKSTTLYYINSLYYTQVLELEDESKLASDTQKIIVIGSESLMELIFKLLDFALNTNIDLQQSEHMTEMKYEGYSHTIRGFLQAYIPKDSANHCPTKYFCQYPRCKVFPKCEFPTFDDDVTFSKIANYVNKEIVGKNIFCPLAEWILIRLFEVPAPLGLIFMFDVPDEVGVDAPSKYFKNFIADLENKSKANMILMATTNQFQSLVRHDFFQRKKSEKFPNMTEEELKLMCKERLQKQNATQNPISDDAWGYIVVAGANNPRNVIRNAGTVLEAMRKEKRCEVADVEYVKRVLESTGEGNYVSVADGLEAVLKNLRDKARASGKPYVSNKEICEMMNKVMKIPISPISLGKRMRGFHYDWRKMEGGMEYKI